METKRYSSGAPWEKRVGYTRAIRKGNTIEVSGTTATEDGKIVGIGDAYIQAKKCFGIIRLAIENLGGGMEDVIRTRVYLTNMNDWEAVGKAHEEEFGDYPPASTMLEVSSFIHPDILLEIEATAIVEG